RSCGSACGSKKPRSEKPRSCGRRRREPPWKRCCISWAWNWSRGARASCARGCSGRPGCSTGGSSRTSPPGPRRSRRPGWRKRPPGGRTPSAGAARQRPPWRSGSIFSRSPQCAPRDP
ncbi:unnamed protein product, partial [Effrenium voratum]